MCFFIDAIVRGHNMANFNADQQKAIAAKNNTILVSAAAGSGKTTVMVEKIKQTLISHPEKHLTNMLVITFTREAATNMRRKLQDLLLDASQDPSLTTGERDIASRALDEIENAQISTIHSFCIQVIRNGFHILDVDPQVRVAEEAETSPMFEKAFVDSINELLDMAEGVSAEEQQRMEHLVRSFTQSELLEACTHLYNALMGIPNPFDRLHELIETIDLPLSDQPWAQEILLSVKMDLLGIPSMLDEEKEMASLLSTYDSIYALAESDQAILTAFLEKADAAPDIQALYTLIDETRDMLGKSKSPRGLTPEEKEVYTRFKDVRGEIKDSDGVLGKAKAELSEVLNVVQIRDNQKIKEQVLGMETLVRRISSLFRAEKQKANVIDFSDMEQMTYRLMTDLVHPEIRENLQKTYTDIYVDESQDISAIQNSIIQALHNADNSLFMVGDVKQSIYRFRHAEPRLFMHFRDTYSLDETAENRKIYFRDNYRSSFNVIACVNEVFKMAMDRQVNELDYEEGDVLVANKLGDFGETEILLIDQEATEEKLLTSSLLEAQCVAVAERISQLLAGETGPKVEPPYQYKDIAILLRNVSTVAPKMIELFKQLHIPVFYDGAMSYYDLSEVSSFLSLLNVIDNLHQDVALLTALKHAPFYMTDNDLMEIRLSCRGHVPFFKAFETCSSEDDTPLGARCREIYGQILEWRLLAGTMSVADFIWRLLRETGFYAVCGAYPDGRLRQNNLDMLYQKARDMERRGIYRLSDFLAEIQAVIDRGQKDSDSPVAGTEDDNCVRIMTMHKSKGLEFRTVILMNLDKSMKTGSNNVLRVDVGQSSEGRPALGLYMPAVNPDFSTKRNTFGNTAFKRREIRNEIAEETRLLYVAMTRAMEKLIMVGSFKQKNLHLWKEPNRVSRIWRTRTLLDMVMPAVLTQMEFPNTGEEISMGPWHLKVIRPKGIKEESEPVIEASVFERIESIKNGPYQELLHVWEKTEEKQYPLKTSVSSMIRTLGIQNQIQREEDLEETFEEKRMPENRIVPFLLDETPGKPRFMEVKKPTAADVGTATHRFMRLIDMALIRGLDREMLTNELEMQIRRLRESGILSEEERRMIDLPKIVEFFLTPLGNRLCNAQKLYREWPFSYQLSRETGTLIQGVMDAVFLEEDQWVLIDYKTDHNTTPGIFVARHEKQMNWYRVAIEALTERSVSEMWLVALRTGSVHPVPRRDMLIEETPGGLGGETNVRE